jgi:hypothetical protein
MSSVVVAPLTVLCQETDCALGLEEMEHVMVTFPPYTTAEPDPITTDGTAAK